jgi:hypothetical protein
VWLEDGRSTLDLFGRNFTLLDLGADPADVERLRAAAAAGRMPLDIVRLTHRPVRDAYERNLVLVRPDGHVAWRGNALDRSASSIVDTVRGVFSPH